MQRSNLIVFIVLAALILSGWFWLANSTKTDKQEAKIEDKEKEAKEKLAKKKKAEEAEAARKKKADELAAIKKKEEEERAKKLPGKEEPAQTVTLGGAGFHLTVDAISRGAAIRKVVLNRFEAADSYGRPTDPPRDFEIIQDDEFAPSFRMYHYLDPKDEHPVFGLGEKNWTLKSKNLAADAVQEVVFTTRVPGLDHVEIVKTYRLAPKDYHLTLLLELHDKRTDENLPKLPFRYQLTGAQGIPVEGEWFTAIFRNALIGIVDRGNGLWRKIEESARISPRKGGDRFPEGERGENRIQYAGVANQYFGVMIAVDDEQPSRDDGGTSPDKILAWARPTLETTEKRGIIVNIGEDDILFLGADKVETRFTLLPRTKRQLTDLGLGKGDRAVLSFYETPAGKPIATWVRLGETLKPQFDDITVRVISEPIDLQPREIVKHQFVLYHGPVKAALLAQFKGEEAVEGELVTRYTHTLHLRTMTDYHSDNWFGRVSSWIGLTWLIIKFTTLMHELLYWLSYLLGWIPGAYGLSIIVLTVIVRGCMFPISRKQALFSIKMQELAPQLKLIADKYPDDPAARWQATQEFNRKHGINPLGSCWPVFLQMPIFLGLYFALQESIHFRLADFLWIKNLSAPDMLLPWSESIPIISTPDHATGFLGALYLGPYLNVLPVLAVVFMMIQQMQTMPPPTDDQQAMQQKMIKFMSIFFGIMFYKVAAGLCIYFIASSLWGLAERKLLPKKKPVGQFLDPPGGTPPDGKPGSGGSGGGKPTPKGPISPIDKGKWAKKEKDKPKDKEAITTFDKLKAMWKEILKQAEKK